LGALGEEKVNDRKLLKTSAARLAPWPRACRALLLAGVATVSCRAAAPIRADDGPDPVLPQLESRFPQAAPLVAQAMKYPARAEANGKRFVLAPPEPESSPESNGPHGRNAPPPVAPRVQLPADAREAFTVAIPAGAVHVRHLGARASTARVERGAVVYDGLAEGTDAVAFATDHGVEELLRIDGAARTPGYEVDLPRGWRLHAPPAVPGLVEVRDDRDVSRLRLRANKAWSADGVEMPVEVAVAGNRVTLRVPESTRGTVLVDPLWESAGTMLVARWWHTATTLPSGKVLFVGGSSLPGGAVSELYDPATGTFTTSGALKYPRIAHTATLLASGSVLVAGGFPCECFWAPFTPSELYDVATGTFSPTGSPSTLRVFHAAVRLPSGKVLVAGGVDANHHALASAEVYDPSTGKFSPAGSMSYPRGAVAAVLLATGKVLVMGDGRELTTGTGNQFAELFDPVTAKFSVTGILNVYRDVPVATLLASGRVLITGGDVASAETYDPSSATFSPTPGSPAVGRDYHTATLLPSGEVLVAGGYDAQNAPVATEELYEPATGTFVSGGTGVTPRAWHTANVLPSGAVLLGGGLGPSKNLESSAETFVPTAKAMVGFGGPVAAPSYHTATLLASGAVLVAGGQTGCCGPAQGSLPENYYSDAELYDPSNGAFFSPVGDMAQARSSATASLLKNGQVLVAGGLGLVDAELYDPASRTFAETGSMRVARFGHTATVLPSGAVLVTGGGNYLASAETYDPGSGSFSYTGSMNIARTIHAAASLASGDVLVVGGLTGFNPLSSSDTAEVYQASMGTFRRTSGNMASGRTAATATTLPTGKVLVTGGYAGSYLLPMALQTAELYDPATDSFSSTAQMQMARQQHTATLLASGMVLVVGGAPSGPAELYDPATGTFETTGAPVLPRWGHTATLLQSGKVLIVGGYMPADLSTYTAGKDRTSYAVSEVYDPATGTFSPLAPDLPARANGTLTLLPTGQLLLAGGTESGVTSSSAQLFDPGRQTFSATGSLGTARSNATATVLSAGEVLLAGGKDASGHPLKSNEYYETGTKTFTAAGALSDARFDHTATHLPNGNVLFVGGTTSTGPTASVEAFVATSRSFSTVGSLQVARTGHTAALLGSGQVLIAGGTDASSNPVTTVEIFDVGKGQTVATLTNEASYSAAAVALADGNAVVALDTAFQEYGATGDVQTLGPSLPMSSAPQHATSFVAAQWLSGDIVACGPTECQDLSPALHAPTDSFWQVMASASTGIARLPDGSLFFEGLGAHGVVQPLPPGVVRPTIGSLQTTSALVPDSVVAIGGTGFQHVSAAGAAGLAAVPGSVPLVFFVPNEGGGPVFGTVQGGWTDTTLSWKVPRTEHPGPGWVHVVVDGVPSVGTFATLAAVAQAQPCDSDAECGSGFCVGDKTKRVCCNTACTGGCESCLASEQAPGGMDGACGPRKEGSAATSGCEPTMDAVCTSTGLCNGRGDCNYPPAGTACTVMGGAGQDGVCASGSCVPTKTTCTTTADCQAGMQCDATGHCTEATFPASPSDPGSCGCSAVGLDRGAAWPWAAVPFVVLVARRRRKTHCPRLDS
jgi:hypothetical protein